MVRRLGYGRARGDLEKIPNNICPECSNAEFAIYFKSGSAKKLGGLCYSCGLVGFFALDYFFTIGRINSPFELIATPLES